LHGLERFLAISNSISEAESLDSKGLMEFFRDN
jgi:hypothetical protein